jgi:hypothetical protein
MHEGARHAPESVYRGDPGKPIRRRLPGWARYWTEISLGWLLTTLGIAGVSGLIRKE